MSSYSKTIVGGILFPKDFLFVGNKPRHVFFFCDAPDAQHVMLAGDFNRGDPTPMRRMPDGRWMASLEVPHGYHQYIFLVDGRRVLDPNASGKARNECNEPVSVIAVS
jgi:1,4-alpha-glucan branching enzyme